MIGRIVQIALAALPTSSICAIVVVRNERGDTKIAIHPQVWQRIGLDDESWERFQRRTKDEVEKARAFLEIL